MVLDNTTTPAKLTSTSVEGLKTELRLLRRLGVIKRELSQQSWQGVKHFVQDNTTASAKLTSMSNAN